MLNKTIYIRTQCLQINGMQHYLGKENAGEVGEERGRVCAN